MSGSGSGRRLTRVPVQLEVQYRTSGNFLVAYSTNLSKGGLFLSTEDPLPVGSTLRLKIAVPGIDEAIEADATVTWVRPRATPEGHPRGMGLEFAGAFGSYGEIIDRVVASFKGLRLLMVGAPGPTRSLVGRYLRSIISCEILELTVGDTLGLAAQQADLVVLDLESSGAEGLEAIRAIKVRTRTPVIAMANDDPDRKAARRDGADEVLGSPPSFSDLQASVIRALARPAGVK